jgi:hypothetical protein
MKTGYLIFLFVILIACSKKERVNKKQIAAITSIKASSILNDNITTRYYPHNIIRPQHGKISIPWAEGKTNEGIGEFIEIQYSEVITFDKIAIINGFNDIEWFTKNNRIKELIIESNGKQQKITLEDTINKVKYPLRESISSNKIKLIIGSIYKGTHFNDTCLSHYELSSGNNKVNIISIPKYNVCAIESKMNFSITCPPGGDPDIIFKSDGTIEKVSMKVYGFASKGHNVLKGKYEIDMTSLKKRKTKTALIPPVEAYLWSAKVKIIFNNKQSYSGYIIDTGELIIGHNHICNPNYNLDSHDISE